MLWVVEAVGDFLQYATYFSVLTIAGYIAYKIVAWKLE